jgi:hypothetical protein
MVVNWLPAGIALHQRVNPSLRLSSFGLAQAQLWNKRWRKKRRRTIELEAVTAYARTCAERGAVSMRFEKPKKKSGRPDFVAGRIAELQ